MNAGSGLLDLMLDLLNSSGLPLRAWLLAAARAAATVLLVPAFGLRAFPTPVRLIWALVLAVAWIPIVPIAAGSGTAAVAALDWEFAGQLLIQLVAGLPVGVGAAILVWVSLMAGGVIDAAYSARTRYDLAESDAGPFATLFSLMASYAFLRFGGVTFFAERLSRVSSAESLNQVLRQVGAQLVASIGLAVAVAGPILAVAVLLELVLLAFQRSVQPVFAEPIVAPVRSLLLLVAIYLSLPLIGQALATAFDFGG